MRCREASIYRQQPGILMVKSTSSAREKRKKKNKTFSHIPVAPCGCLTPLDLSSLNLISVLFFSISTFSLFIFFLARFLSTNRNWNVSQRIPDSSIRIQEEKVKFLLSHGCMCWRIIKREFHFLLITGRRT